MSLYRVQLELRASRHELARKEAELNFAREVQQALFPRQFPVNCGLEFAAICVPARGISGDYYDVMELSDGRVVFAIADISGKGISAAILMSNLHAVLRTLAEAGHSPAEVCSQLNCHLYKVTEATRFATFFYAEWDRGERCLRYVNAGHNPPILRGAAGSRQLEAGSPPLGILRPLRAYGREGSTSARGDACAVL
jgi:sigma-B regulation protein RsbU (phosphoserine phosphatase)